MFLDSYAVREQTLLTPLKVAQRTTFLEWDSQPTLFKHYPHFCYRISLHDVPALAWLSHVRSITALRTVAQKPYYQLNVPSAGNLHPLEIYVQVRNVTGVLCGIYHLDVVSEQLVLIQEIEADGVESYVGMENRFNGFMVMVSLVPFRSSWKYGLRAWRYLYLDLGHQLGALSATVRHFGLEMTKMSQIKANELNRMMGMGEDECIAAVYGIGKAGTRLVKELKNPLMSVQPTNYTVKNENLSVNIKNTPIYSCSNDVTQWDDYLNINRNRRSAREFYAESMKDSILGAVMQLCVTKSLEVIGIVVQAHSMQYGVYRNGRLSITGNYRTELVHLLLEQRFIAGANMVLLIYANQFTAHAHVDAGMYAQYVYLVCEHLGVGCSGIGAFYDEEASQWSDKPLLYAVAIGGKS
jgi:SagB-type dehydrogenase family enzyme